MNKIRPFIKWAGGKGSLLSQISKYYPIDLTDGKIDTYIEPFLGGGAVLIDILQRYPIKKAYAFDINGDLINAFKCVKEYPEELISELDKIQKEYISYDEEKRKEYYYKIRDDYNSDNKNNEEIKRAVQFIFLNRTCFNGLYRVSKTGKFNVPCGKYKNPMICDAQNIRSLSKLFKNVTFINAPYSECEKYIDNKTFVYFDPPYRPLNKTSAFTSYTKDDFNDDDQIKLSKFFNELNTKDVHVMLSNSNPKNTNKDDDFFEKIYAGFSINEIMANRNINSNSEGRGAITELLITNTKRSV